MTKTYLAHHGIKGQKWGIRRFQNSDGTLTAEGKDRYSDSTRSGGTQKVKVKGKVKVKVQGPVKVKIVDHSKTFKNVAVGIAAVAGVSLATYGIIKAKKKVDGFISKANDAIGAVKDIPKDLADSGKKVMTAAQNYAKEKTSSVKSAIKNEARDTAKFYKGVAQKAAGAVKNEARDTAKFYKGVAQKAAGAVKNEARDTAKFYKDAAQKAAGAVKNEARDTAKFYKGAAQKVAGAVKNEARDTAKFYKGVAQKTGKTTSEYFDKIRKGFKKAGK